ncbi:VOC family protein [Sabulibacter ruber]|uniref:VOC family protein n=1 Tax=Sabulibacter ruber TaxID=2811901 RepID=UPI001A9702FB|nr:VOC family protein [Sabulibacter ruber]
MEIQQTYQQKITPFLWFNGNAEEAMNFYTSIFKNSRIKFMTRYGEAGPGPAGEVITGSFELEGQEFMALNGGPAYTFTPALSLFVHCEDQAEVDYLWEKLLEGGVPNRCGWLQDKFGVSWQIIPRILGELLHGKHADTSGRVMQAMLQMTKIDIATLQQAYEAETVA